MLWGLIMRVSGFFLRGESGVLTPCPLSNGDGKEWWNCRIVNGGYIF